MGWWEKPSALCPSVLCSQLPNFKFLSKELGSPKDVAQALADYGDRQQCGLICTGTRHRVEGDKRCVLPILWPISGEHPPEMC